MYYCRRSPALAPRSSKQLPLPRARGAQAQHERPAAARAAALTARRPSHLALSAMARRRAISATGQAFQSVHVASTRGTASATAARGWCRGTDSAGRAAAARRISARCCAARRGSILGPAADATAYGAMLGRHAASGTAAKRVAKRCFTAGKQESRRVPLHCTVQTLAKAATNGRQWRAPCCTVKACG